MSSKKYLVTSCQVRESILFSSWRRSGEGTDKLGEYVVGQSVVVRFLRLLLLEIVCFLGLVVGPEVAIRVLQDEVVGLRLVVTRHHDVLGLGELLRNHGG